MQSPMQAFAAAFKGEEHQSFTLQAGSAAALLVHGFPGTPDEMRPLATSLHQAGWTAQAVLLPGFGPQLETLNERTYAEWLNAVTTSLVELERHHSPVILVGNSMGGSLATAAASQHPVDGLVLLAPFYTLPHVLWRILPAIRLLMKEFKPFRLLKLDFRNPEVKAGIHNFMPSVNLDDPATQKAILEFAIPLNMINQIRTAGLEAYRAARKVNAPALVIQGKQDDLVRPELTQQLIRQLAGSTDYREVNAAHDLVLKHRPAWRQVEQAVLEFAARVTPETAR
jgi:carboxylesterase